MAAIGQAETNAHLVRDLLVACGLEKGTRLLFAGAGPGQMFDYVDGAFLKQCEMTFTDINPEFLSLLAERLRAAGLDQAKTVLDDLENPVVESSFDWIVLVLVLEHVKWRPVLEALSRNAKSGFVMIIQKNPEDMKSAVAPNRVLPPSLQEAMKGEHAELLDSEELTDFLSNLGFQLEQEDRRQVADEKQMCGFVFKRTAALLDA